MAADPQRLEMERHVGKAGALLHSLVPRAQAFSFYDRHRSCVWSSDGGDDFEVDGFIADLADEALDGLDNGDEPPRRTLPSGRTALALPVRGEGHEPAGTLVALFSRNAGKSSSFNPGVIRSILKPALAVITESMYIGRDLEEAKRATDKVRKELKLVYEVDEKVHGARTRHSSLAQLIGQSGRRSGSASARPTRAGRALTERCWIVISSSSCCRGWRDSENP